MKIELSHLRKCFGKDVVIPDLSLTIEDRAFAVLLGPSGCGKTTLLRMIAGLEKPDGGDILFDGVPVFSKERRIFVPPEKRDLGFVFQDFALWPHMTVEENVAFGLVMKGKKEGMEKKVAEALDAVHMSEYRSRKPGDLSGGQQQRVALARAIASTSKCILFDESLSALDAVLRVEMRDELKRLTRAFQVTSVFVTHDQGEAMSLADKIAVLDKGVLQQYAPPEDVYNHPATAFTASFVGRSNWIDDHSLFRPEGAHRQKEEGDEAFDTKVTALRYTGGQYEMDLSWEGRKWLVRTSRPEKAGEACTIYVSPKDIIHVG